MNHSGCRVLVLCLLSSAASGQVLSFPSSQGSAMTSMASSALNLVQATQMDSNLWQINTQNRSSLESPTGTLSKLDLKAPGKARHEFEKGYQLLLRKDLQASVDHLTTATTIYPSFVSAFNALGTAYLSLNQNEQAREQFAKAVSLDDHLPNSYLNLGCAELALQHYPAAEQALQKASDIAPLDLSVLTALSYGQFMNHNFTGAVATAGKVHERRHQGASMVHFYAAAAYEAQNDLVKAQRELVTLLKEDPKSQAAAQAVQMMDQLKEEQKHPRTANVASALNATYTTVPSGPPTPSELPERVRQLLEAAKQNAQIAEAEAAAAENDCLDCDSKVAPDESPSATVVVPAPRPKRSGFVFRSSTDEVAVFFTATDHGRSVTTLTGSDIGLQDNSRPPAAITSFRNEAQLPLRLGLLIDSSASVLSRFKFEQDAAANFMQKVVTRDNDEAFVVGFSNSVLLVQDFTPDKSLISRAVGELVPAGGTAIWDAVDFATAKLANLAEEHPVAKILVVISDGEDNSSSVKLKDAIARAQKADVAVYTISTRENLADPGITTADVSAQVGEHALSTLATLTGGAAFSPGSIHRFKGSLNDLQEVIRSRYMISYRPALIEANGKYHAIDIKAEKAGHKLKVYARKGYYASAGTTASADHF